MTPSASGPDAAPRVVLLLWACGLAVRLLPFRLVAARVLRVRRRSREVSVDDLTAQVARAARLVWPLAGCLAEALVLGRLLLAHGHEARVVVGVSRAGGTFAAHAWVEHEGRAIGTGAETRDRFAVLGRVGPRGVEGRL